MLSIRLLRASIASRTNTNLRSYLDSALGIAAAGIGARARTDDARGRLHRRRAARSPDPASRWRSDSSSDSPWRCLAQLVSYTDAGLIHKDIKPANVLVDSATGRVRLTGFGIASRLPRERQSPEPPEFIAGTLAYMAPEQTGRVNRSIDSRSDLYSLGVTFYEMLTGSLPFTASDPMEWVHCHIARQPAAPSERLRTFRRRSPRSR